MNSNLVSLADRTTDERREIARAGGLASGEARRERKRLRDGLEAALAGTYTVNGIEADGLTHVCVGLVRRAMEGDPRAFCALRDSVGEKPAERVDVAAEIDPAVRARVEAIIGGVGE